MTVANPSLPEPKRPQVFVVPVRVTVDSDEGAVRTERIEACLKEPLEQVLSDHIYDRFDRLEGLPADFALHELKPEWGAAYEVVPSELDAQIERVLQEKEAAVLDQDFPRAAELRTRGRELIERRNRVAAMGLPPLLRTALAAALAVCRMNPDWAKEVSGDGAVGREHFVMLQKRFGLAGE